MGQSPGKPWQVCIVRAEGGEVQRPVPDRRDQADPSWSPDGSSLAFGGQAGARKGGRQSERHPRIGLADPPGLRSAWVTRPVVATLVARGRPYCCHVE